MKIEGTAVEVGTVGDFRDGNGAAVPALQNELDESFLKGMDRLQFLPFLTTGNEQQNHLPMYELWCKSIKKGQNGGLPSHSNLLFVESGYLYNYYNFDI